MRRSTIVPSLLLFVLGAGPTWAGGGGGRTAAPPPPSTTDDPKAPTTPTSTPPSTSTPPPTSIPPPTSTPPVSTPSAPPSTQPASTATDVSIEGRHAIEGLLEADGRPVTGTLDLIPDGAGWRVVREVRVDGGPASRSEGRGQVEGDQLRVVFAAPGGLAGRVASGATDLRAQYFIVADGALDGRVRERTADGREVWTRERAGPATECVNPGPAPAAPATEDPDVLDPEAQPPSTPAVEGAIAARIVQAARAARDLGWDGGPADRQEAYAELLFPHDQDAQRRQMAASMSSCGLFGMACLRQAGVSHASLETPYAKQIGKAIANLVAIGRERGCWLAASKAGDREPAPGDMVLVGSTNDAAAWGGIEHVLVVTERRGDLVVSVDGGQAGHSIREKTRRLDKGRGQLWLRSAEGTGGRRVQGWLDASGLDR